MPEKHTIQPPRGTRDFYPEDMAIRRHIEKVWREVSINHGFEEIEGPMFEHLDLYTVKSGEGIVSELFSFQREGGDTRYALRPEFTPTLARMYAARAKQLPKPTKWFVIPNHFRAERPQRGRLREFIQWNIDIIGDDSPRADAEIIACTVNILKRLGLTSNDIQIQLNHRGWFESLLVSHGVTESQMPACFSLIDRYHKTSIDEFDRQAAAIGLAEDTTSAIKSYFVRADAQAPFVEDFRRQKATSDAHKSLQAVFDALEEASVIEWCDLDYSIVRGLAYYTGTVFEVHERSGDERAIAGGGRYDNLIELFGGPPTPAVGIAMGDVVLRLVLEDHNLLDPAQEYMPRPDVFVIVGSEGAGRAAMEVISRLRRCTSVLRPNGYHVRHSYRATRNIKKLLGEADKSRATFALIFGDEYEEGLVTLKNLETGHQGDPIRIHEIEKALDDALHASRE